MGPLSIPIHYNAVSFYSVILREEEKCYHKRLAFQQNYLNSSHAASFRCRRPSFFIWFKRRWHHQRKDARSNIRSQSAPFSGTAWQCGCGALTCCHFTVTKLRPSFWHWKETAPVFCFFDTKPAVGWQGSDKSCHVEMLKKGPYFFPPGN